MSGFISSLLVEPIVRQARRLSHQTASSSAPENYEHEHTQQISFLSNNHDSEDVAAMPSNGYFGLGQASGYANPANESPISPNLRPFELANQVQETQRDQENEDALLSGQFRNEHRCDDNISENPAENSVTSVRDMDSRSGHPTEISTAAHDTSTVLRVRDSLVALETTFEMEEIAARSALPEDDGMGVLRRRIHAIRDLDIGSTEKARMIHNLMTEKYNASRIDLASHPHPIESSPGKLRISDHSKLETTHGNQSRFDEFSVTPESNINQSNPYNLTREDLEPTFSPKVEQDLCVGDGDDMETEEFEEVCLGCEHYKRNVKLQCYACKKWYTCRFCHDQVEDHHLNRRMTENMLCMLCGCAQPASQWCKECGEQTAQYYCNVCKLWDNDSKKNIYHCSDCGICRIGQGLGKDFFHCRVTTTNH
ncbi:hypothetical protein PHISCL_02031 [Aspergillus sclerotialis]|uniref:CHY-type domain-containing protein n=1 Tax=Aspergillus sclerotialis TaxID=2070753 RepID=A0A3A2ZR57_9EURO|nr:hypothetical protein PHISCL_02031 [Aspergillus sclerotialis]